jgi:benzil reductase ((S)-benzoin forming)
MFIITGGGSGIGKALAFALSKRGKMVLIVGRRLPLLQETACASSLIQTLCADVSTTEGLSAIKDALSDVSQVEGLINNAGTLQPLAAIKNISPEDWQHTFHTNLDAPLFLPQLLYDKLVNGRVLNIGSGAASLAIEGWAAYCVSKAALAMLTRCWQSESTSIAFASVKPGIVDTDMQAIARQGINMDPLHVDFYKDLEQRHLLISTETVAEFLIWLLLDIDQDTYVSQEWDIYDKSHHSHWLKPPQRVLHWQ